MPRKSEAKWYEKYGYWKIAVQQGGTRKAFYSSTPGKRGKIAAEKAADKWLESGQHGGNTRCRQLFAEWIAYEREVRGDAPAVRQAERYGDTYILPRIGNIRAAALTPHDLQAVIDRAFAERGLARKTLQNIRGVLNAWLKYCRSCRVDICRPDDPLSIPRDADARERHILQPADLRMLFTDDSIVYRNRRVPAWFVHAWRVAVIMGWRPGEVIGLQWADISGDVVKISRAINTDGQLTRGKNANARRTVKLPPAAVAEISEQRLMLDAAGVRSLFVFPARDGGPASEASVYQALRRYLAQHGLASVSLYELRHTMVSINRETPEAYLKTVVGHSAAMDTRRQYGHALTDQADRAADYLQRALDDVLA